MNAVIPPQRETRPGADGQTRVPPPEIPAYLDQVYWWAYIHPRGIDLFDRQWITNSILWGNFARLRDAALAALQPPLAGRTLQVACVYGDFTPKLAQAAAPGGWIDVVDVVPQQLANLGAKLAFGDPVTLHRCDSADLQFESGSFDRVVLFFLLHEQPEDVRRRTLAEAWRVLRPGGQMLVVDYHRPAWWHPLRYLFAPVLRWLEPFAMDLWNHDVRSWMPPEAAQSVREKRFYFGGLYQLLLLTR